jgi:hypothetical protein
MIYNDNNIEIIIENNLNDLNEKKIIQIYAYIYTIIKMEKKKGNELEKAQIKISYVNNMLIKEYINIFNLCKNSTLYEFISYIKNMKNHYKEQNTNTNVILNEYINSIEVKQSILLKFVFKIHTTKKEHKNIYNKYIKLINAEDSIDMILKLL